jgi:hypothetical protein
MASSSELHGVVAKRLLRASRDGYIRIIFVKPAMVPFFFPALSYSFIGIAVHEGF